MVIIYEIVSDLVVCKFLGVLNAVDDTECPSWNKVSLYNLQFKSNGASA